MAVTNYHTVNGEIVGETTSGVRTDYLVDALGGVTGTVNQSAQVLNTYRYKPYGALLAKTGTAPDPKSQWVGTLGYRATSRAQSDYYVRARHYGSVTGMWTTVDQFWPWEWAYAYGGQAPTKLVDPAGASVETGKILAVIAAPYCLVECTMRLCCAWLQAGDPNSTMRIAISRCRSKYG